MYPPTNHILTPELERLVQQSQKLERLTAKPEGAQRIQHLGKGKGGVTVCVFLRVSG